MEDTAVGSDRNNIEVALVDKELMHMVFGFVGFTDLPSLALVCRRWLELSRADEVMRVLLVGRVQSMSVDVHHTGLGYHVDVSSRQLRVIRALAHETIVQVSTVVETYETDKQHTLALTLDGEVYAFGDNSDGKLGLGDAAVGTVIYKPTLVSALCGEKIIKVAAAGAHSAALTSRGSIFTWGFSRNCRLGLHPTPSARLVPVPTEVMCIGDNSHNGGGAETARPFIVDLWCGKNITLLLNDQGVLYSFGVANCLGRPSRQDNGVGFERDGLPQPVVFPAGVKIKAAAMGSAHGLAITTDGQVYSWGENNKGQLGHSHREKNRATPEVISTLGGKRAVQVACGAWHSLVLTEDNVLYSFDAYHQVQADGHSHVVDLVEGLDPIIAISAGQKQSVVLFESGRVVELDMTETPRVRKIKPENWIVPRGICAGDLNSAFIVY